jgi:hypothetical protein
VPTVYKLSGPQLPASPKGLSRPVCNGVAFTLAQDVDSCIFYFQIFHLITSTFLLHIIHRQTYNYKFTNHVTYTESFILFAECTFLAASKMLCSCGLRSDVLLLMQVG